MMDLRELYQEILQDHDRHPRNFRVIENATHHARGHNPLCGDQVTVYLVLDGDRIGDVSFQGKGCRISKAAASIMTEVLKGKTVGEAHKLFERFHACATGGELKEMPEPLEEDAERFDAFGGVKKYPMRVKCATLPWHAFEAALKSGSAGDTVKTE